MSEIFISERMPVLALRGLTVFPKQMIHFDVGRDKSLKALEMAMKSDQKVFLVTQKNLEDDDPTPQQLFEIGVVAHIKQLLKVQGDMVRVLVYGEYRGKIDTVLQLEPCMAARVVSVQEQLPESKGPRVEAYMREAVLLFNDYLEITQKPAQEIQLQLMAAQDPGYIADTICQYVGFRFEYKYQILSTAHAAARLVSVVRMLKHELRVLEIEAGQDQRTD